MSTSTPYPLLELSDGSDIHVGDKRRVTATFTDSAGTAAEPTQAKIKFTALSSGNATTYAKTPGSGESSMTQSSTGVYYADHEFDEGGWWDIVAIGSGNMTETEPARRYVIPVPNAPA